MLKTTALLAALIALFGAQAFAADLASEESTFLELAASRAYASAAQNPDPLVDYWMTTVASSEADLKTSQAKLAELDQLIANPGQDTSEYLKRAQGTLKFATAGLRQLQLMMTAEKSFKPTPRLVKDRQMAAKYAPIAKGLAQASKAVLETPSQEKEVARLKSERAMQAAILDFNKMDLPLQQAALEKAKSASAAFRSQPHSDAEIRANLIASYAQRLDQETQTGLGAPVYQLTVLERLAIEGYTGSFYMAVNPALWTGKDLESLQPFIDYLSSALKHLPEYRGIAFRKIKMEETQLAAHAVGQTVVYKGFTSTSVDDGFQSDSRNVDLKIHSLHGRLIAPYSIHFGENEVLFDANSKFKVIGQRTRSDGKVEIELTEL